LLATRHIIDIIFVVLVIVAISITTIVVARVVADTSRPTIDSSVLEGTKLVITDPDVNQEPAKTPTSPPSRSTSDKSQIGRPELAGPLDHPAAKAVYEYAPFTLPITWGAVAGTVIWRGKVRSRWSRQGYDYDTFRLVSKMRGSPTRIRLLNAIRDERKNKLQLAKELGVDWKTINNHAEMLVEARLIEENGVVGTARYYSITESGRKILSLLATDELEERKE
jgi:DNA-binding MarR family transcriptional regulator